MVDVTAKSPESPAGNAGSRRPAIRPSIGQYGAAVAAIAAALAVRVLMAPILQDEAPYMFFVPAVLIAAGAGGFLPGLLAIGLGTLLGFHFTLSFPSLSSAEIVNA